MGGKYNRWVREVTPLTERRDHAVQRAAWRLLLLAGVAVMLPWRTHLAGTVTTAAGADQPLHTAVSQRLAAGEPYYDVVGQELRRRGFPTASVFNWRTPLLPTALAVSPRLARVVFVVLGVIIVVGTVWLLSSLPVPAVIAGCLAQSGAVMVIFDSDVWVFPEVWSGFCVALALLAYAAGRPRWGMGLALTALLARELAFPCPLVAGVLAARARRRDEVRVWIAGFTAFALFYGWHVWQIILHQHPGEAAHASSWIRFGGPAFVVETLRTNSLLFHAPVWAASAAFLVLVAGLTSEDVPPHLRWVVLLFIVFFAIVGQPFNWYWGWLPGFALPLVFAYGVASAGETRRLLSRAIVRQT
jgi:hypothetical protein